MPNDEASEVTFVFPGMGGQVTGVCRMAYSGLPLKHYLTEPPLKSHGLLQFLHKKGRAFNRKGDRVKLWYPPVRGDVIVLKKTLSR